MTYSILQLGDACLRKRAAEIPHAHICSDEIQHLIESMKEILYAAPGVGLAAPQIGVSLQLIVIEDKEWYFENMLPEIRQERGRRVIPFHVIINPQLQILESETAYYFEGCLSIAGCFRIMPRATKIKVECFDETGAAKTIHAEGWYARILQHEIDHLHGKLYIDSADPATEMVFDEDSRQRWLNATQQDVLDYLESCCLK